MTQAVNLAQVGSNANSGGTLITSGTAVASTSGTSIDFTSIPSWVKRITVMFNGVSTNGTSLVQVQIGAGSVTTSGYAGYAGYVINAGATSTGTLTTGLAVDNYGNAALARTGLLIITLIGSNTWVSQSQNAASTVFGFGNSSITLGGTLDRVRITTINGTDTFDAGSINILYE